MGYIVQTDEVALARQEKYRLDAIMAGKRACAAQNATAEANIKERAFDYVNDFALPTIPALTAGLAGWLTVPMPVPGVPALYSIFAANAAGFFAPFVPIVPPTQVWVFYKYCIPYATTFPVSYLIFSSGNAGQFRKDEFDLEPCYAKLSTDGFFSDPVVYVKGDSCVATLRARIAGPAIAFVLQGWVFEPKQ